MPLRSEGYGALEWVSAVATMITNISTTVARPIPVPWNKSLRTVIRIRKVMRREKEKTCFVTAASQVFIMEVEVAIKLADGLAVNCARNLL